MKGRWRTVLPLSALGGFVAIAHEIVWARLFNYATGSRALAFGMMLGGYLLGLALGSAWIQRAGRRSEISTRLPLWLMVATLMGWLVPLGYSWMMLVWPWWTGLVMMVPAAALLGTVFPALAEAAIVPDADSGRGMARMYVSNILGSGAGSLLTGFVLFEWLPMWGVVALLTLLGTVLALWLARATGAVVSRTWLWLAGAALVLTPLGYSGLWERLHYKEQHQWGWRFEHVVEGRHGVVAVDQSQGVYGNGAYDGRIVTTLEDDRWLVRPYFLSAVHPRPSRVLVIGLATGSWTQILAHHPDVESITAIEINPSYMEIIPRYPAVASLLENPKIEIVIDDGRRWLRRHREARFDAIVMNTTHHWREFASNLLSREFLEEVSAHLASGGVVMWNCTGSSRAAKTGMDVFPHTLMVMNNCLASNQPLRVDRDRWRHVLMSYRLDGASIWTGSEAERTNSVAEVMEILDRDQAMTEEQPYVLQLRATMELLHGEAEVITEDNLGHEFSFFGPE